MKNLLDVCISDDPIINTLCTRNNFWTEIIANDGEAIRLAVEKGSDRVTTILFLKSIEDDHLIVLEYLRSFNFDAHNIPRRQILYLLDRNIKLSLVKFLCEWIPSEIFGCVDYYYKLMMKSFGDGRLDIIKYLYESMDLDHETYDIIMCSAASNGHIDIIKYLHQNNIFVQLDNSMTCACSSGHIDIVKYLYECGASHRQVLYYAAYHGHLNVVQYLCENGYDMNSDPSDYIAIACHNKDFDMVKYMVGYGAKITEFAVTEAIRIGDVQIVKYLYENADDFNKFSKRPLYLAAGNNKVDVIKYQHNIGIDIYYDDILRDACFFGSYDVVKYLCENGVDIHAHNNGALVTAIERNHLNIVIYLCENGADINSNNGKALVCACTKGNLFIVKYLCENGANVYINDNLPLQMAQKYKKYNVSDYLSQFY